VCYPITGKPHKRLSICHSAVHFADLPRLPGDEVDSMAAVAKAYAERSLQGFQAALDAHREQLAGDPVVHTHLQVILFQGLHFDLYIPASLPSVLLPHAHDSQLHTRCSLAGWCRPEPRTQRAKLPRLAPEWQLRWHLGIRSLTH
jgi:hypothetical protein